jgi:hypothetical protein
MEDVVIIDIGSPADSGAIERLMQAIEHRILRRADALERYSQIGSESGDPVIVLVRAETIPGGIVADERSAVA